MVALGAAMEPQQKSRPRFILRAGVTLVDLMLGTGKKLDGVGCELGLADLPFDVDPVGAQLPEGKVSFYSLTSGEIWVLAGGHDEIPLQCFAGTPSPQ